MDRKQAERINKTKASDIVLAFSPAAGESLVLIFYCSVICNTV